MRITGGALRGRRLVRPVLSTVRPTRELVRQAIFDVLGDYVAQCQVLDIYSGSGALGFEALSRGAAAVTFIERDFRCVEVLRANSQALAADKQTRILAQDCRRGLNILVRERALFSLVFADPPYQATSIKNFLFRLSACAIVTATAVIVVEHAARESLPVTVASFQRWLAKRYGDTGVSFYRNTYEGVAPDGVAGIVPRIV